MKLSKFGTRFTARTGILSLMDDLGEAMAGDADRLMLGGGNPGHIPAVEALFRERMQAVMSNPGQFERMVGNYDPPDGSKAFREALAALLANAFGWDVGARNIALTNGSQSAFFMLFNLFGGPSAGGEARKILLPLAPEYIGYADIGLDAAFFVSTKPTIEHIDARTFKYHVDFDALSMGNDIGAICVSRPTNPTGNVLGDAEIERLVGMAAARDIPLIIDNAYGTPFPNIIFTDAKPVWTRNIIVTMSLSKLGLPGLRTGIVIAREAVIRALAGINAILNLATGSFGPALTLELVRSGDILSMSRDLIRPFYQDKATQAVALLHSELAGYDYHVHKPEGAIFLWLWFRDLPITCEDLYQRLKQRNVLVIAGQHFFPGLPGEWRHKHECIRVNYSQGSDTVHRGIRIIAEEVKRAYREGS